MSAWVCHARCCHVRCSRWLMMSGRGAGVKTEVHEYRAEAAIHMSLLGVQGKVCTSQTMGHLKISSCGVCPAALEELSPPTQCCGTKNKRLRDQDIKNCGN
eukprot:scaffold268638_cov18-Tisochrysis_lutea.AAC.1